MALDVPSRLAIHTLLDASIKLGECCARRWRAGSTGSRASTVLSSLERTVQMMLRSLEVDSDAIGKELGCWWGVQGRGAQG